MIKLLLLALYIKKKKLMWWLPLFSRSHVFDINWTNPVAVLPWRTTIRWAGFLFSIVFKLIVENADSQMYALPNNSTIARGKFLRIILWIYFSKLFPEINVFLVKHFTYKSHLSVWKSKDHIPKYQLSLDRKLILYMYTF